LKSFIGLKFPTYVTLKMSLSSLSKRLCPYYTKCPLPGPLMALGAYMAWDTVKNLALDYYFPKDLSGQVAVITGAGSGIGRGIAVSLAKIGVKVALWDLNFEGMEETMRMVKEVGGEGAIYKVNVCDKVGGV
jgi:hypothetical protein